MEVVHARRHPVVKRTHAKFPHTGGAKKRFLIGECHKMAPEFWGGWGEIGPFTPNALHMRRNPVDGATPLPPPTTRKQGAFCSINRRFFARRNAFFVSTPGSWISETPKFSY